MTKQKFDHNTNDFINEYVRALRENNAAVFAGAGLSVEPGYFDWKKLLAPIAKKLQLDINEEHDLAALAQYFVDNKGGVRDQLTKILTTEFNKTGIKLSENHKILARLPIPIFWTTNYDNLIETALRDAGKLPDVKITHAHLTVNIPKRDAIVYKMHGDVSDLANTVLTKHEYEDYNLNRELFSNAFKADFVARTMLFVGFSFTDPNLDYLISRIRSIQQRNTKTDYYFLKREKSKKALNRQQIRARSLERYGLYAVWINDYPQITEVLSEIERRFLRSTIFISGSADDYGKMKRNAPQLIQNLSKELALLNYKIVSGFGLNVGTYVVNGVLQAMEKQNNQRIDTYLSLRPFPLINEDSPESKNIQRQYRKRIVEEAGIEIIVFGNKTFNGDLIDASGVNEEFEIAKEKGLKIIPIPSTGFAAKKFYNKILENFENYYNDYPKLKSVFKKLGQSNLTESDIINTVIKIISSLNEF